MHKPVRKTPSLPGFDSDIEPQAETLSFVKLVGDRPTEPVTFAERVRPEVAAGEKGKARDIIAAIKTLKDIDNRLTPATPAERAILARFPGFGPVALSIFPNPATGEFKPGWEEIGQELKELLTPEEYASAKRTTFNAFYTSPTVIDAMHQSLNRLGVPENALILEPGCGVGRFIQLGKRYLGVELDGISGRIAKALHPEADIRIENFTDTKLPQLDAVIGNVPFADVKLEHNGQKFSLHDYFFAKSVDALKPGGVMALVTSHYTLDKTNAAIREYLGERADFLGAIRLPSDAFKKEGTSVVTDIVFVRKRSLDEPLSHADPEWLKTEPTDIDGRSLPINAYFKHHPEMVLGTYSGKDSLYGEGYSVKSNGALVEQLKQAVERLPAPVPKQDVETHQTEAESQIAPAPKFVPPPPERHISEGSFFVNDGRIHQVVNGNSEPVVYGGGELWANGALVGRRMSNLIELRDKARRVLQSQNDGWPEAERQRARADLNRSYDWFRSAFGPVNKTTISEGKDGATVRRMPNLVKFREDPDAMLVMALEEYDEQTGEAKKAPILLRDVVGKTPPITSVTTAEEGLLVSLNNRGVVDLPYISQLYGKPEEVVVSELGDLIYQNPETKHWEPADQYLSGNVRAKLAAAEKAGIEQNVDALKAVQPEDVLPGDIDANLGAPWIPASDIQAFASHLFGVEPSSITVSHLQKDAVWSVEGDYSAERSVANTTDYGTTRASGLWLLGLALNQKTPTIYDPAPGDPDKRVVNQEATLAAKEKQKVIKEQFKNWVFADADRTERLVRIYNETYNSLRPRIFDGSHLDFPGMSQAINLRPHQRDAIWRGMSGGNTLLAHCVGAGKSYELAATAMKMKQAGLINKPLITIPNHLLEQFAREFQQLYPNAKLLVAGKDDFSRDRRKQLTAKIASGEWDAIIMTHSSFERIGMSRDFQERFLREQIADYDALLTEQAAEKYSKARRNIIKTIEKQKAAREAKLKDLLANDKKDDGLVFDDLGVDHVMVDECFTHDTLVETDQGPLKIGDIVNNRMQVKVKTFGFSSNVVEWKPVVNWFPNKRKGRLLEVFHESGSFICTHQHKLWIAGKGYRKAGEIKPGEELLVLRCGIYSERHPRRAETEALLASMSPSIPNRHEGLRVLREGVPIRDGGAGARRSQALLLPDVQDGGSVGQAGHQGIVAKVDAARLGKRSDERTEKSWCVGLAREAQPDAESRIQGENDTHAQGARNQASGDVRKRLPASGSAGASGREDGNAAGACHPNGTNPIPHRAVAEPLQGRSGRSVPDAGCGSGWEVACGRHGAVSGREEGQGLIASRVVRVEVLEPGSDGEYRLGGRTHQVVYDIEVADNHNYFANGALVSNCHYFKNLETPTKMDRVAGIQTGGSERAFDLYMKCRYLDEQHAGHGVTFATGTPISNSLVELYTMQRFLDPAGLRDRGIEHFDAWAATFGEVVESMEISPDGKTLKPRARFSKFVNLPELQQMFRAFSDVQTAEMLNLPTPKLEGGKPQVVACEMSDEQCEIQQKLVERYERIRNGGVDPREDNALAITTDGRKLALDARMLSPSAPDFPGSKINAMVENVVAIWKRTAPTKGTQMIFCDMGVNPTAWGFSAYEEATRKLIEQGIPRDQIAVMGEADSDAKKQALFEKVRNGTIRVLIGSTSKMGTGTNVQKRLVAMHHLDAPWKPAEVEQRDGRILRQGNQNAEVSIYRYVTEGSFDAYMWQALETKAKFIGQIMTGESGVRQAEDVGGQELSYAEVKAIASGNPAVLVLAEADAELQRLGVLRRNHADEQYLARKNLRELPQAIERMDQRLAALESDAKTVNGGDAGTLTVNNRSIAPQDPAFANALSRIPEQVEYRRRFPLGRYSGLAFGIEKHSGGSADVYLDGETSRHTMLSRESQGPRAVLNALGRIVDTYGELIDNVRKDRELAERQLGDYQLRLGKPFLHAAYIDELTALRDRLKVSLSGTPAEGEPTAAELAEQIKALKDGHVVEAAPLRVKKGKPDAPKPVNPPVVEESHELPKAEEPPPEDDDKPVISFRSKVRPTGTQQSLF
ncbi:MAG: hypothetical protein K8U57_35865 [Planctomycetes bacterium]|nr:hypothetical protein [Planctomycetota bacterium]